MCAHAYLCKLSVISSGSRTITTSTALSEAMSLALCLDYNFISVFSELNLFPQTGSSYNVNSIIVVGGLCRTAVVQCFVSSSFLSLYFFARAAQHKANDHLAGSIASKIEHKQEEEISACHEATRPAR